MSLDVLTINEDPKNKEELVEIVGKAFDYFPRGMWKSVEYQGNVDIEHDMQITVKSQVYEAFIFNRLVKRLRKYKNLFQIFNPLLGMTSDPVVIDFSRFERGVYERTVYLVKDYVLTDVGIVSLFRVREEFSSKIVGHGLGHNKGLNHCKVTVDLMHKDLLNYIDSVESFCKKCEERLKSNVE